MKKFLLPFVLAALCAAQAVNNGGGGGGGTPGGSPGDVQCNVASAFGACVQTNVNSLSRGGFVQVLAEPNPTNPEGFGAFTAAVIRDIYQSGTQQPANYGNTGGYMDVVRIFNGRNSADNNDKKTQFGRNLNVNHMGAGQRFGDLVTVGCYGVGDCGLRDSVAYGGSYINAGGDEGIIGSGIRIYQVGSQLDTTISSSTKSTCSTTLSAGVSKSTSATDFKTVAVASTTGCAAGDYVTVDQGTFESGDVNHETVLLTAVSGGNITAIFQQDHSSSAPVSGATVLVLASMPSDNTNDKNLGVGRVMVLTDSSSYSTGTVSGVSGTTVTGSSTTWTTAMVGGNASLAGCIEYDSQKVTNGPWTNLTSWWPIRSRDSNTQLTLTRQTDSFSQGTVAGTYKIVPCARIETLAVVCDTATVTAGPCTTGAADYTKMYISKVVLESNSFTWTVGKAITQSVSPYSNVQHANLCLVNWYGPTSGLGDCYRVSNPGNQTMNTAFLADSDALNNAGRAGFHYGMTISAYTQSGVLNLIGKDLSGVGVILKTYSGDDKIIQWSGGAAANQMATSFSTGNYNISTLGSPTAQFFRLTGTTTPSQFSSAILQDINNGWRSFVINPSNLDATLGPLNVATLNIRPQDDFTIPTDVTTANNSNFFTVTGGVDLRAFVTPGDRISLSSASGTYATVTCIDNVTFCTSVNLGNGTSQSVNVKRSIAAFDIRGGNRAVTIDDRGFLMLGDIRNGKSAIFDTSGVTDLRTITLPDVGGTLGLSTGTLNANHLASFNSSGQIVDSGISLLLTGATGSISGNLTLATCNSGTASVTGARTTMGVVATPVTYPGDGTVWEAYVSSNDTVTVKECGLGVVTPTATAYNVRVIQ